MIKWILAFGFLLLMTYVKADYVSDLDYDAEVEDDEYISPSLQQEMDSAFDSEDDLQLELDQLLADKAFYSENIENTYGFDETSLLETAFNNNEDNFQETNQEKANSVATKYNFLTETKELSVKKRDIRLNNLVERIFILLQSKEEKPRYAILRTKQAKNRTPISCSKFVGPSNAEHHCRVISTFLGSISLCHSTCKQGFSYLKETPKYELCGKATKFRWTYQLRGLNRAVERCITETTDFVGKIWKRDTGQDSVSNGENTITAESAPTTTTRPTTTLSNLTTTSSSTDPTTTRTTPMETKPTSTSTTTVIPVENITRSTAPTTAVIPTKICTTSQCTASAAYYMNKLDFTVKPCDNFFDYACGRWIKETPIPKNENKYQTYTVIRDRVDTNIANLLAKPIKRSEGSAVAKTKISYRSCINTDLINELDGKPLLDFLTGYLTWPIINDDWEPTSFDFETTLAILRGKYNNQIITKVEVHPTNGIHVLQTWKGKMALPYSYYFERKHEYKLDAYYDLMYDIAMMLGADQNTAYYDVLDVRKLEKEIARHKLGDFDFFNVMTIDSMMKQLPGINWLKLFKTMIQTHPINGFTSLEVWNKEYLMNFINILQRTDPRTMQNYMVWRIVKHRVRNLSKRFELRYLQYQKVLNGKRALSSRMTKCARTLTFEMVSPVSYLFIDKYFSKSKKKAALNLFHFIRKGFLHLLNTEVTWMDEQTRAYARKKALAVTPHIGYNPKLFKNLTLIDHNYKKLKVDVNDYFGNILRTLTLISQNKFKVLGVFYNISEVPFTARPTMVNAFYNPSKNTITLPAGEMQYPFYWGHDFPRSFQFGGIGTILGHELTHGFDDRGRFYDVKGQRNNWWTPSSVKQFNNRAQCMKRQYSNYYIKEAGEDMSGKSTLSENIADNGGIREAYMGYKFWLQAHNISGEELEPSTGLTNDQMFFVGFANIRCAKYTKKGALYEVGNDVHTVGRYRVIGSLQNFDEFSKAFQCPVGSYMNPKKKCVIW